MTEKDTIEFPILKDTEKTLQDMKEGQKFIRKIQSGECPKCGTPIEDYGTQELLDFTAYYPFTCKKCGFSGREWYDLTFTGFTDDAGEDVVNEIRAEAHSDDRRHEINFDAKMYFINTSDKELQALEDSGWGGDYPADKVAQYFENTNKEMKKLFDYCRNNDVGYECHVNKEDAILWIKKNRPMYRNDIVAIELKEGKDVEKLYNTLAGALGEQP